MEGALQRVKKKGSLIAVVSLGNAARLVLASLPRLNGPASSLRELINGRVLLAAWCAPEFLGRGLLCWTWKGSVVHCPKACLCLHQMRTCEDEDDVLLEVKNTRWIEPIFVRSQPVVGLRHRECSNWELHQGSSDPLSIAKLLHIAKF